jgi:hypothetical protein
MAVGANNSNVQVINSLWTGVVPMRIVAINPTQDEMKTMGMNAQKEPEYKTQVDAKDNVPAHTKFRIDLYLQNDQNKIKAKLSIWLEATPRVSQKGSNQYINNKGQYAYPKKGETQINYDWFSKDGLREAYIGEDTLIDFTKAWLNVDFNSNCSYDTIAKMVEGDISELVSYWKQFKGNEVRVLLGVVEKDNKHYQAVYSKYFGRYTQLNFDGFRTSLEGEYGAFKGADYQDDLHLRPYEGKAEAPSDKPHVPITPGTPNRTGGYNF